MNIVFDLDGTLVDSAPDLMAASNRMLEREGLEPLDLATVTSFVGNGLPKLVERVMRARAIPQGEFSRLYDAVHDFYNAAPADSSRPFPGVPELLAQLKARGHRLGVCTNKPEEPARLVLKLLGLADWLEVIVGGDTLTEKKPHPAPLLLAFSRLPDGPRLFVGDSEIDSEVARTAGVPFALFTEGYRKTAVENLRHDVRFDRFDQLAGIVDTLDTTQTPA